MKTQRQKFLRQFVQSIIAPLPRLTADEVKRNRIPLRKLVTVGDAHRQAEEHFSRLFRDLERACNQTAEESAGRTEAEIRARLKRRCDAIFRRRPFKLSSDSAPLPNESDNRNTCRGRQVKEKLYEPKND